MADAKITQLTENTTPVGADLLAQVDDPSGSPITKKVTITNVLTQGFGDNAPNIAPKARAYASSATSLSATSWTKVTLATENYDVGNDFASSAFTAPVSGYYAIHAGVEVSALASGKFIHPAIYVNGGVAARTKVWTATSGAHAGAISSIQYVGSGQTIELYCYNSDSSSRDTVTGSEITFLSVHLLSI